MKRACLKGIVCGALLCLFPVAMQAQLITMHQFDGATYNLRSIPCHASDFFDYGAFKMFQPSEGEFMPGWGWDVTRFTGSRKPVSVEITGTSQGNILDRWTGPSPIRITYDGQGKPLTYLSDIEDEVFGGIIHDKATFQYDGDGDLKNVQYDTWGISHSIRLDTPLGRIQSTLNGKPQDIVLNNGTLRLYFDDDIRVIQSDFHFYKNYFNGTHSSPDITFYYTYDNAGNIVKITVKRYLEEAKEDDNAVLMRYDSENRLVEQTLVGYKDGTKRFVYAYDENGYVTHVDEYEYYTSDLSTPSGVFRKKYDLRYDDKGKVISAQSHGLSHHYGDNSGFNGIDDIWRPGEYVTYAYDEYGNWTTLKVYMAPNSSSPYSTVHRSLRYADDTDKISSSVRASATSRTSVTAPAGNDASSSGSVTDTGEPSVMSQIMQKQQKGELQEAKAQIDELMKEKPDDGNIMALQAYQLSLEKRYGPSVTLAKKAVETLKNSHQDLRTAGAILVRCAMKPAQDYSHRSDFRQDTYIQLVERGVEAIETLKKADPGNLCGWYAYLSSLFEQLVDIGVPGYAEKLEALKKEQP